MKKLITIFLMTILIAGTYSCSSHRETERADPDAGLNEPMRDKNQAVNNTPGHQKDEIRQNK